MKIHSIFLAVIAIYSLPAAVNAQSASDDDNDELEEILVTTTRLQKSITAIPQTITVISQKRIEQSKLINNSLSGVLELNVPGFGPSQDKLVGRGETLRGRNPLYLIDGVPQHNPLRDSQRDGHHIDLDFVERVEVIHGSNSIQGVGATGGVINTMTKSATEDGYSSDVAYRLTTGDNFDSDGFAHHISYLGGYKAGILATSFGVAYTKQDLYFDGNNDPVGLFPTQGDTMDSSTKSFFFKSIARPADGHRLQLMINSFNLERDGDYIAVAGDRSIGQLVATVPGDPRPLVGLPAQNDVLTASLDYVAEDLSSWQLISQLYYQDFKGRFEGGTFGGFFRLTPDGEPFLDQSQVVSEKVGLKTLINRNDLLDGKLGLTLGFDLSEDSTAQELALSGREWVPNTKMTDKSPFIQVDIAATESLQLNAGVRYENVTLKVDDYVTIADANSTPVAGGSPDFSDTLVNFGAIFNINSSWTIYASFAEGFTIPDVGRILRNINEPGFSVETLIDLTPVVTDNTEIGVRFASGAFDFDVSVYQSKSDFGSRLQFTPDGTNAFVAREKTKIDGFDIAANYTINDRVMIGGNYANTDARFDSNDDGTVDTDLDGVNQAPNKLVLYVSGEIPGGIIGRIDAVKLFDREFTGPGIAANRLGFIDFSDDYTLFNLSAQKETDIGVFSLGIRNLLDEQYVAYYAQVDPAQSRNSYFAGRGRTLTFGYSTRF
jgi:iron complex outermembrane receptor protein